LNEERVEQVIMELMEIKHSVSNKPYALITTRDRIFIEIALASAYNIKMLEGTVEQIVVATASIIINQRMEKYKDINISESDIGKIVYITVMNVMRPEILNTSMESDLMRLENLNTDMEVDPLKKASHFYTENPILSTLTQIIDSLCSSKKKVELNHSEDCYYPPPVISLDFDATISTMSEILTPESAFLSTEEADFECHPTPKTNQISLSKQKNKLTKKERLVKEIESFTFFIVDILDSGLDINDAVINSAMAKWVEIRKQSLNTPLVRVNSASRHYVSLALQAAHNVKKAGKGDVETIVAIVSTILLKQRLKSSN